MNSPDKPTAKVVFRVRAEDGTENVETLWAFSLGNDKYKIDNLPYFAFDVSWNDVVFAPPDAEDGRPTFQRVLEKSGNRTLRIIFDVPVEEGNASQKTLDKITAAGCGYERANSKYIVVNVPPDVDLQSVVEIMTDAQIDWEYADPSYETLHSGH